MLTGSRKSGEMVVRRALEDGWSAVGVAPGATDERLDGLDAEFLPFRAPGTAASALQAAGPLAALETRDLDAEDWWFRCRFTAEPDAADEETSLRLEGLATIAQVWLNGVHVLSSADMHVAHEIAVRELLRDENELVIGITALAPLLASKRPRARWRTRLVLDQGLRWFRTTLVGRIPAFAPGPAPVGPWRPVSLVRRRSVALDDLALRAIVAGTDGIVRIAGSWRALGSSLPTGGSLRVVGPGCEVEAELRFEDGRVEAAALIPDPELWWPHTHGRPALYEVSASVLGEWGEASFDCGRVGFRTVEVVDDPGLVVSVNGEPIFCRGGNVLPDALGVDRRGDDLRRLLTFARDAGMNMIRLPGVGVYGSEELYALCDELGILVWQDFPFASLDYPADDDAFCSAIDHEARSFLGAAGAHPSLVVLCGNSEIEQQVAMLGLGLELGRGALFDLLLPGLVKELDVDAHYVTSSPTGGELPFRPGAGVAHYFGVGAYRRPLDDARRADVRFATECLAFANVPGEAVLAELGVADSHQPTWKAGVPRDSGAGWDFDDVRDHYLRELFRLDPVLLRSVDPERYRACSRVVTGEVMAATLGEWRRGRSACTGALLWTLNDILPGAGWGVLDSRGRPKAAYWYVSRALAPVSVWMTDEGTNGIAVHAANDTHEPTRAELGVRLVRADGRAVEAGAAELELGPHTVVETSVEGILGRFVDAGHAYRFGPPACDVIAVELRVNGALRSRALHFPGGLSAASAALEDGGLEAVGTVGDDGHVTAVVHSRRLAYADAVDAPHYSTSDDFFSIPPGGSHTLALTPRGADASYRGIRLRPLNSLGSAELRVS
jgi:beta-mannosidase